MKNNSILQKYQLPLFFLLAYLLSWWSVPFAQGQILPQGPALAALIVVSLAGGLLGLKRWWQRTSNWRTAWYWYLVGPGIILAYQGLAFLIMLLLRAPVQHFPALPSLAILTELLLLGGLWEEPGWTGYALPKLLDRFAARPVVAVLLLGVFRSIWHLPLFYFGYIPWFDVFFFEIAVQVIIAWLYLRSGGSVPVVIVFHFFSNILGAVFSPVFAGDAALAYKALFMGLALILAIFLLVSIARQGERHRLEGLSLSR